MCRRTLSAAETTEQQICNSPTGNPREGSPTEPPGRPLRLGSTKAVTLPHLWHKTAGAGTLWLGPKSAGDIGKPSQLASMSFATGFPARKNLVFPCAPSTKPSLSQGCIQGRSRVGGGWGRTQTLPQGNMPHMPDYRCLNTAPGQQCSLGSQREPEPASPNREPSPT